MTSMCIIIMMLLLKSVVGKFKGFKSAMLANSKDLSVHYQLSCLFLNLLTVIVEFICHGISVIYMFATHAIYINTNLFIYGIVKFKM